GPQDGPQVNGGGGLTGRQYVVGTGTAIGTLVNAGGVQSVQSGGVASATTVKSGGVEVVSSGGTISGTTISGGTVDFAGGASNGAVTLAFVNDTVTFTTTSQS